MIKFCERQIEHEQKLPEHMLVNLNFEPLAESKVKDSKFDFDYYDADMLEAKQNIGNDLTLEAMRFNSIEDETITFQFLITHKDKKLLEAELQLSKFKKKDLEASTRIQRFDNSGETKLPKGFGLKFYKELIAFISELPKRLKKDIHHFVSMHLSLSKTPLTPERWREIFVPILKQWDYEDRGDDTWSKVYVID